MGTDKPAVESAAEKNFGRIAGCAALNCAGECMEFAYTGRTDGFRICACGHTQNIHRHGAVT